MASITNVVNYDKIHSPEFRQFIQRFLAKGGLNQNSIESFTQPEDMAVYRLAFTHKSAELDEDNTYELLEFEGDVVVNLAVVKHIRIRFPHILNKGFLNKIKHRTISFKTYGRLAEQEGFFNYIVYGEEVIDSIDKYGTGPSNSIYIGMLEDVLEAVMGAIQRVVDSKREEGVGFAVCNRIASVLLSTIEISLGYIDNWGSITILKETFDEQNKKLKLEWNARGGEVPEKYLWKFDKRNPRTEEFTGDDGRKYYKTTVYGKPDKRNPAKAVMLAESVSVNKKEAGEQTSKLALVFLREHYDIKPRMPNIPFLEL